MAITSGKGISRANSNRAIRQDALRDQLSAQAHVQHVIDIADKLTDLAGPDHAGTDLDMLQIARLKAAADIKLKLIGKYLPDLKQVEAKFTKEIILTDIGKVQDDLRKLEQGQTIDSTSRDITNE